VLGSPIAHSRSPQLHLAAYRALGLTDWTYDRIECDAAGLPPLVGGFGPEWVGVSVTMPGKFAALRFADRRTARAELVGSANTLVRTATGWLADNTDVDGVTGALGAVSGRAVVLGSGGTAPAAVVALAELGVDGVAVVARNPDKAARVVELARGLGVPAPFRPRWRGDTRRCWRRFRCCWTRSTTRGRRHWRWRWPRRAGR
jgi:shikimate dehydrogenase